MIRKVLSFEIREVRDRILEFVGSTEDKDRMGDVIMASGWQLKNYKKNPVFLWAHQYDTPPVGKAVKVWLDDNRLKFHIQFATPEEYEFADTIYKLYKGGYLRATSVGFLPLDSEPMEKGEDTYMRPTRYLKQDLLELSACPVPANPHALAEAKAKGLMDEDILHELENAEVIDLTESPLEAHEDDVIVGGDYSATPGIEDEEAHKAAISYNSAHPGGTPRAKDDEEWDAGQEVSAAEVDDLKVMCAIVQGDPDLKTSYKLPHHKAKKGHPVVWQGVAAAGAVLMGARGGIDASEAEKTGAKAHLAKHYEEFGRKPPWKEEAYKQESVADELDYCAILLNEEGLNEGNLELAWRVVDQIMRLSGGDIPVEIAGRLREVLAPPAPELTEADIKDLIVETVGQVIAQARGITYGGKK